MTKEVLVENMTWKEIRKAQSDDCIIAIVVGSTEQHGPHLPVSTDVHIPLGIAKAIASKLNVIIAPPIPYGHYSQVRSGGGGERFPGTTSLRSSTLVQLLTDIIDAFMHHGFRKFLILNGHYENYQLIGESVQKAIESRNNARALIVNYWELIPTKTIEEVYGNNFPGWEIEHAGVAETSMMMALKPELVKRELIQDNKPPRRPEYDIVPPPDDTIPRNGVPWKPSPATKEKGEKLLHVAVEKIIQALKLDLIDNTPA
jgi:creatinine amidohydrolase